MAFGGEFDKEKVTFGDMDIIFDERGSQFLTMRKVQWVKRGDEPDESKAKLEMRKYTIDKNGQEVCGKGVAFLTEEGPHNLVKEFVANGFGHTDEVLKELVKREDFKDAVEHLSDDTNDSVSSTDFFDMRSLLLGAAKELDKEDEDDDYEIYVAV